MPRPALPNLQITKTTRQAAGSGTWVCGRVGQTYRFDALVFPEHAENPGYEIGSSRISKLWIWRTDNDRMVYGWDRGLDIDATTPEVRQVLDGLCATLARLTYGH